MVLEHLKHQTADIFATRQYVLQQIPYSLRHTPVVSIHPKAITPGSTRNVDLTHGTQPHAIHRRKRVKPVVNRIAVNIVQIQKLVTATAAYNGIHQPDVVANVEITRQARQVVSRVLEQKRHSVPL